jgi:tRNA dimethylallyltransferase
MDIGSSKPTQTEMGTVRHHLIDIVNPDYHFTAGDFCIRASSACERIVERGKMPLIVGGTGFYINSFFDGIDEIPDIDESVKKSVSFEYDNGNSDNLYSELCGVDPVFASKVHRNDRQRIIRGVSVFRDTGRSISSYFSDKDENKKFDTLYIGLYIEKETIHKRIDLRVDSMIKKGFVEEVTHLRAMGYKSSLYSMQSIGYAEINLYIDGLISLESAIDNIKINTKKYAKKQMTWFKKNKNVIWFSPDEIKKIPDKVKNWII